VTPEDGDVLGRGVKVIGDSGSEGEPAGESWYGTAWTARAVGRVRTEREKGKVKGGKEGSRTENTSDLTRKILSSAFAFGGLFTVGQTGDD
jgi:hypothetical protein